MKWLVLVASAACSTDTFVGPDGSTGDSGTDDVRSGDGGSIEACASSPMVCAANTVCSDFDETQTIAPFGDASQNAGTAVIVSDQFMTCPHAVAATAPQTSGQAHGAIGASTNLVATGLPAQHARVELDVLLPKVVTGPTAFLLMYVNGDTSNAVALVFQSGNWNVRNPVSGDTSNDINPRVGDWSHLALDVGFSAQDNFAHVELDYVDVNGKVQQVFITNKPTSAGATISSVAFAAGVIPIATTAASMTTFIDDVVWTPF